MFVSENEICLRCCGCDFSSRFCCLPADRASVWPVMQPLQQCSDTNLKNSVARVSKQAPLQGGAGGGGAAPGAFNGRINEKV